MKDKVTMPEKRMSILCILLNHRFKNTILEVYKEPIIITKFNENSGTTSVTTCKTKRECLRCGLTIIED
jgi:hypothetical protein